MSSTELLGCQFHYNQAIYRTIQNKGLQDAYQNIEVVRQTLRWIMGLAFVPADQIKNVYNDVIKPQVNNVPAKPTALRQNLREFFKYFEIYWLRKIDEFCVFNHPTRTNNTLEGNVSNILITFPILDTVFFLHVMENFRLLKEYLVTSLFSCSKN